MRTPPAEARKSHGGSYGEAASRHHFNRPVPSQSSTPSCCVKFQVSQLARTDFRISDFGLPSALGFRPSDFIHTLQCASIMLMVGMGKFFASNIDRRGRVVRAIWGVACI